MDTRKIVSVNEIKNKYHKERILVFLFVFFVIFEGALRKWFLPFLASPLVVVRDPIALLLVIQGFRKGILLNNFYVYSSMILSLISFPLAFFLDDTNLMVAYYGTRIFLLYMPSIFVMSKVLTYSDVLFMGKWCLYISIPMTILIIMQYFSPQSALVNRGIGNDANGSGFGGTGGFFRPSGIFSFTQGYVCFQSFVVSYIVLFLFDVRSRLRANISNVLLYISLVFFLISLPFSISRTCIFQSLLVFVCAIVSSTLCRRNRTTSLRCSFVLIILCCCLALIPQVRASIDIMMLRFEQAKSSEGDFIQGSLIFRYFGSLIRPWFSDDVTLLGHGIGQGTRLAMNTFNLRFFTDDEWMRILYESGYILGAAFLLIRLFLTMEITFLTFIQSIRDRNFEAWIFLPSSFFLLMQGAWGNAVPLGFTVVSVAFSLILLKRVPRKINLENRKR